MKRKVITIIKLVRLGLFAFTIIPVIYLSISSIQLIDNMIHPKIEIVDIDNKEIKDLNGNEYIYANGIYAKIEPAEPDYFERPTIPKSIKNKVYRTKDKSYYVVSHYTAYKLPADGKDLKYNKDTAVLEYTEGNQTKIVMNLQTRGYETSEFAWRLVGLIILSLLSIFGCCMPAFWSWDDTANTPYKSTQSNEGFASVEFELNNVVTPILSIIIIMCIKFIMN